MLARFRSEAERRVLVELVRRNEVLTRLYASARDARLAQGDWEDVEADVALRQAERRVKALKLAGKAEALTAMLEELRSRR